MGVVLHVCNASAQEAEAGGSHVQAQPGLHSKTSTKQTDKTTATKENTEQNSRKQNIGVVGVAQ
jgi:hypothetical protein